MSKAEELGKVVKLPEYRGGNWQEIVLNLFEDLGWDREAMLDPTKIIINEEDWKGLSDACFATVQDSPDARVGIGMALVNYAPSGDNKVKQGTVLLKVGCF